MTAPPTPDVPASLTMRRAADNIRDFVAARSADLKFLPAVAELLDAASTNADYFVGSHQPPIHAAARKVARVWLSEMARLNPETAPSAGPASSGAAEIGSPVPQGTSEALRPATAAEARQAGAIGWNIRCNRCGSYGAQWVPDQRPGWWYGNLALCPVDRQALDNEERRHERALADLRTINYEQERRGFDPEAEVTR